jgi:hypothetical protein
MENKNTTPEKFTDYAWDIIEMLEGGQSTTIPYERRTLDAMEVILNSQFTASSSIKLLIDDRQLKIIPIHLVRL